jgi:hypothetical protein
MVASKVHAAVACCVTVAALACSESAGPSSGDSLPRVRFGDAQTDAPPASVESGLRDSAGDGARKDGLPGDATSSDGRGSDARGPDAPAVDAGVLPCDPKIGATCGLLETCNILSCTTGATGTCVPLPGDCGDVFDPVCGCDGATYSNDCQRLKAGIPFNHMGAC